MDQQIERERRPDDQKSNVDKHDNEEEKLHEGLPMKDSPYLQYKDLEDYKSKAYGTQGHLEPKPSHGAGASTDAPTLSGGSIASETEALSREAIKR